MADAPGGLVDPSLTGGSFLNPAYATPQQRAMLYAYGNELMKPQPINNGWQGLASIARSPIGGWEVHQAAVQEQASRGQAWAESPFGPIASPSSNAGGGSMPAAGSVTAGSSSLGSVNNNPGNIRDGEFAASHPGYSGASRGFAVFDTPEHGIAATDQNLSAYGKRGINTPLAIA